MPPQHYPSAWTCPLLRLWTPSPTHTHTHTHTSYKNLPLCMNLPVYGYVMHFFTPIPAYGPAYFHAIFIRTQFKKWVCPHPTLGSSLLTLIFHLYCCSYAMKPDGRRAKHIIVEKSWPNRKETLIISVKLQPNIIHSRLGVISVRSRISRLKKLCIIKPIWRIRHFVDQQTTRVSVYKS